MKQKIDLSPKDELKPFTAQTFLVTLGGAAILFVSITCLLGLLALGKHMKLSSLEKKIETLQSEMQSNQTEPNRDLEKRYALLKKQVDSLSKKEGKEDAPQSFSTLLDNLSKSSVEGLWLTTISQSNEENTLMLQGKAKSPDLVIQMLQNLKEHQKTKTPLKTFRLEQDASKPEYLFTAKGGV